MTSKHHKSEGLFHQLRHARFLGEDHLYIDRLVFLFGESRENRFCSLEKTRSWRLSTLRVVMYRRCFANVLWMCVFHMSTLWVCPGLTYSINHGSSDWIFVRAFLRFPISRRWRTSKITWRQCSCWRFLDFRKLSGRLKPTFCFHRKLSKSIYWVNTCIP